MKRITDAVAIFCITLAIGLISVLAIAGAYFLARHVADIYGNGWGLVTLAMMLVVYGSAAVALAVFFEDRLT